MINCNYYIYSNLYNFFNKSKYFIYYVNYKPFTFFCQAKTFASRIPSSQNNTSALNFLFPAKPKILSYKFIKHNLYDSILQSNYKIFFLYLLHFYLNFFQMPDISYIFLNCSVRWKLSYIRRVQNRRFCPSGLISICLFHLFLSLCIRKKIF